MNSHSGTSETQRQEIAASVNGYIGEYVRFADAKAGAILTAQASLTVAIAATISELLSAVKLSYAITHVLAVIFLLVLAVAIAFSIVVCIRVLKPSIRAHPTLRLLVSFPDIAAMSAEAYVADFRQASTEALLEHLVRHNKMLADVAMEKFRNVKLAVCGLNVALFLSFFIVSLYVFVRLSVS